MKEKIPRWFTFCLGLLIGFFLATLIQITPSTLSIPFNAVLKSPIKAPEEKKAPVFNFYKLLPGSSDSLDSPDSSDLIDSSNAIESNQDPKQELVEKSKSASENKYVYFIQVASFQKKKDASKLKARLLLNGFNTVVNKTITVDQSIWYRVQVGPYASDKEVQKSREMLADEKITDVLILKKIKFD